MKRLGFLKKGIWLVVPISIGTTVHAGEKKTQQATATLEATATLTVKVTDSGKPPFPIGGADVCVRPDPGQVERDSGQLTD